MTDHDVPLFLVAAGVYLERDGKILVIQRATGVLVGFWTIPGGILDRGESPADAARRELFEETGLRTAGPLTLIAVTAFPVYGHDAIRLVYAADAAEGDVRLSHEHSGARWIDPHEYRRTHLSDAEVERWRARDPKDAMIVQAVRAIFDDYLAWRATRGR
jgi:8-oxo-dGTP diphosphatase